MSWLRRHSADLIRLGILACSVVVVHPQSSSLSPLVVVRRRARFGVVDAVVRRRRRNPDA
eukprot:7619524-Pyramimonas_sp.AAC.1